MPIGSQRRFRFSSRWFDHGSTGEHGRELGNPRSLGTRLASSGTDCARTHNRGFFLLFTIPRVLKRRYKLNGAVCRTPLLLLPKTSTLCVATGAGCRVRRENCGDVGIRVRRSRWRAPPQERLLRQFCSTSRSSRAHGLWPFHTLGRQPIAVGGLVVARSDREKEAASNAHGSSGAR